MKFARNHTPIIIDTIRAGATLVTKESPIGERYSSPTVKTAVDVMSHHTLPGVPAVMPRAAAIMIRNPSPVSAQPIAIFTMLEGSWFFFACDAQSAVSAGVKNQIMKGLNDWYHVEGIVKPRIVGHRVFESAHSWSVLPCCS